MSLQIIDKMVRASVRAAVMVDIQPWVPKNIMRCARGVRLVFPESSFIWRLGPSEHLPRLALFES